MIWPFKRKQRKVEEPVGSITFPTPEESWGRVTDVFVVTDQGVIHMEMKKPEAEEARNET